MNNNRVTFINRSILSVKLLLKEIAKFPLLTAEDEYRLWQRMQEDCHAAREQLINCNMRFVLSEARKYLRSGVAFEDLVICGAIGLTRAADRFEATRGYRFITYAVWWIEDEMKKAITEHWSHHNTKSLDAPINPYDSTEERTYFDIIENGNENAPDWAMTYLSEMEAVKEKVRKRHFDEAASILEDAIVMKEKGYGLFDVARKHRVSEEKVRQLLDMIKRELKDDFKSSSYHIAA